MQPPIGSPKRNPRNETETSFDKRGMIRALKTRHAFKVCPVTCCEWFFLPFLYDEVLTSATGKGGALITEINCVFYIRKQKNDGRRENLAPLVYMYPIWGFRLCHCYLEASSHCVNCADCWRNQNGFMHTCEAMNLHLLDRVSMQVRACSALMLFPELLQLGGWRKNKSPCTPKKKKNDGNKLATRNRNRGNQDGS